MITALFGSAGRASSMTAIMFHPEQHACGYQAYSSGDGQSSRRRVFLAKTTPGVLTRRDPQKRHCVFMCEHGCGPRNSLTLVLVFQTMAKVRADLLVVVCCVWVAGLPATARRTQRKRSR